MTNQHPLTDEMMRKIHGNRPGYSNPFDEDDMRAAADWQLEQVKEAVSAKIADLRQFPGWKEDAGTLEFYFYEILKTLRPQEDNA